MARPARYDREAVVEAAMRGFWEQGYAGCDVETLTRRAGVNRHSLYGAFGGKAGLFRAALEHYVAHVTSPYLAILDAGTGLDDLAAYFDAVAGDAGTSDPDGNGGYDRRGCLVTNSIAELGDGDPAVAAIIAAYHERVERAFAALIRRGQVGGSIRAGLDPVAAARWLRMTTQGISVAARFGQPVPDLAGVVRAALAADPPSLKPPSLQGEEAR